MLKKRRYMFYGAEVDLNDMNDDSETESDQVINQKVLTKNDYFTHFIFSSIVT